MQYLTKQGKDRINWTDYTWNPLGWGCSFGCEYCYARKLAYRQMNACDKCNQFVPHFHPERLNAPQQLKTPSKIFPCDMSDLFGRGVEHEWQAKIFGVMQETPHIYQTLTKQGQGILGLPDNLWFGVSCHSQAMVTPAKNILRSVVRQPIKWVSFEPLLSAIDAPELLDLVQWVVIGALSKGGKKIQPQGDWVARILDECNQRNIPVCFKNNLVWDFTLEQFPK